MKIPAKALALAAISIGALGLASCNKAPDQTDWELLGNSSDLQYRSELTQIDRDNVKGLGLVWSADIPTPSGLVGNPLVKDGIVFQGGPRGFVVANDVKTGKVLWTYQPDIDMTEFSLVAKWGMNYNRGIALADGNVIIPVACKLVALDQKTGKVAWESESCDSKDAYAITAAPRVGGGLVFTGNACMDTGLSRGYVDAFDTKTGKKVWRWYTVPGDPSKPQDKFYADAAKTWGTDWYKITKGCGSPWEAITYDSKLDRIYVGVDVAAPIFAAWRAPDAGDELYSGAVVALDAKTGKYIWHFTITPNDNANYTPTGIMIADLPNGDKTERSVLVVPKNGFIYRLDAETGKFVSGKDYIPQNWAKGLDKNGHAIKVKPEEQKDEFGLPSGLGGHNWEPMAFDPKNNTIFIPSQVAPMAALKVKMKNGEMGHIGADFFYGNPYGDLVAWDVVNMKAKWRVKNKMSVDGGVMFTDGGLVVQGTADGMLNIYNSDDGTLLWSKNVGGVPRAAPSTVMVDGKQYLLVSVGNASGSAITSILYKTATTAQSRAGGTRLLAFALDGKAPMPAAGEPLEVPKPTRPRTDEGSDLAVRGLGVFTGNACTECHGWGGHSVGGYVPNLGLTQPDFARLKMVVQGGALQATGMPKFDQLTDEDLKGLEQYLTNEAWVAYDKQAKK